MGEDSIKPFLEFSNKWVVLLALTSNKGAFDFQFLANKTSKRRLFGEVLVKSQQWGTSQNMMYVIGATKADMLADVRISFRIISCWCLASEPRGAAFRMSPNTD